MLFIPGKSRRRSHRKWVSVPVLISHRGSRLEGHSINVSQGGMFLFAAAHLSPGTQIEIEFRPPDSTEVFRAAGIVRRRALYLYAIEFLRDHAAVTRDRTVVQAENPESLGLAIRAVCCAMTLAAKDDHVFLRICAASATMLQMVQFEVIPPATTLTSPAITFEHPLAQLLVVAG